VIHQAEPHNRHGVTSPIRAVDDITLLTWCRPGPASVMFNRLLQLTLLLWSRWNAP